MHTSANASQPARFQRLAPRRGEKRTIIAVAHHMLIILYVGAHQKTRFFGRAPASVTINPPEATVHVGQTQTFEAVVKGTHSTGIRWAVEERNGGRITEDGSYTAPRHVGLYHVVATSEENPAAKAVAKVTLVTEYDTPDSQKLS